MVSRYAQIEHITEDWGGTNLDLWLSLAAVVSEAPGRIKVTKVKGHALWGDVDHGLVSFLDKRGNACADGLARDGANKHAMLPFILDRARERRKQTMKIQQAMVDILMERGTDLGDIRDILPRPDRGGFLRRVRQRR